MLKKIDKNYYIIIILALAFVMLAIPAGFLFGSLVDWLPQHIMFPSYFRDLFYETGQLIPDFAFNLGAGQNIFNFSYYGLLNPVILPSYLLPFVDMTTYLIFTNIVLYVATGVLFYKWMKRHFDEKISFFVTILILCASPLLYHFHRHFMFVSYMPFLILGFMGIENHFNKKRSTLLIVSTFLIIMTSYFYSLPSIMAFVIYGVYIYLKKEKNGTVATFLKQGILFILPILIGILMSAVLLIPTFLSIVSGRSGDSVTSIASLFIPKMNLDAILYSNYSIGLTAIAFIALLYGFMHQKRENRFLSICTFILFIFPIFSYVLNGFLYVRDKIWIPFLPLFGFMIGIFLKDLLDKKIEIKKIPIFIACLLWICLLGYRTPWFYLECILVLGIVSFYIKHPNKKIILFFLLLVPITLMLVMNYSEKYVSKDLYKEAIQSDKEIEKVLKKETSIVRTAHLDESLYNVNKVYKGNYNIDTIYSSIYNSSYKDFYQDVFKNPLSYRNKLITAQNNNLLYQMFMGDKYMYSKRGMQGYKKISKNIYQNDNVFPLLYVNKHVINEKEFEKLRYPETVISLLKNSVVKGDTRYKKDIHIQQTDIPYEISENYGLSIKKKASGYEIKAEDENHLLLSLNGDYSGKLILIDFKLTEEWDCSEGDSRIRINGIDNTLTCKQWIYKNKNRRFHYVIADEHLKELDISFHRGKYNIKDIHIYELDYKEIQDIKEDINEVILDKSKTKGNKIAGSVDTNEDGYLITSIPYDEGFTIYDNGNQIKTEKVNTAFLGARLKKGTHQIRIVYHAPGLFTGKIVSITGFCIFTLHMVIQKTGNNKKKRHKL